MSRLEETIISINAVRDAIRKESKSANPILFTVPILSQIAVSLAVIADAMNDERKNKQNNGHWIQSDLDSDYVTCSNCKRLELKGRMAYRKDYAKEMRHCLLCGARMDEVTE